MRVWLAILPQNWLPWQCLLSDRRGFPLTSKVGESQGIDLVRESQGILPVVREALERKRKAESEEDQQVATRKRAAVQIKLLEAKKVKLMTEATSEMRKVDSEKAELMKL